MTFVVRYAHDGPKPDSGNVIKRARKDKNAKRTQHLAQYSPPQSSTKGQKTQPCNEFTGVNSGYSWRSSVYVQPMGFRAAHCCDLFPWSMTGSIHDNRGAYF